MYGYQGMPMGGGGQMPFGSGPPFMPPGPPLPLNPPSNAAAAHHVPPGSGSVVLVSNLDPEVRAVYYLLPEPHATCSCVLYTVA